MQPGACPPALWQGSGFIRRFFWRPKVLFCGRDLLTRNTSSFLAKRRPILSERAESPELVDGSLGQKVCVRPCLSRLSQHTPGGQASADGSVANSILVTISVN
jgi:hypothetical protein